MILSYYRPADDDCYTARIDTDNEGSLHEVTLDSVVRFV